MKSALSFVGIIRKECCPFMETIALVAVLIITYAIIAKIRRK